MTSTHEAELDLPMLPPDARHVHIVPELTSLSLISIGQLCDAGCIVTFTATAVTCEWNEQIILVGHRAPKTRLWHLELPNSDPVRSSSPISHSPTQQANATIGAATPAQLVAFAHATLFSPPLSTLEQALKKGYLTNFPGLTATLLRKYPPQSIPMIKGHLDQTRQNLRSTKDKPTDVPTDSDDYPITPTGHERTHHCYVALMEPTGQVYTDQTGRFITPSSTGNNYLMVLYDYDSNSIMAAPIKSRTDKAILDGYKVLHTRLCRAGLRPQLQRLDNECSQVLKEYMTEQKVDFQLVPPGVHRRNAAERAIRTFKNHFIAGLCSVDKDFPLHLWDRLLPQAEISLNLLRGSRLNPQLSAWAQLNGTFDYNRTPLAPPGTRVVAHVKPSDRTTWSPHGLDGWYIGPALDSYRCYRIWIWETRAKRTCDTVEWFPTKVTLPYASSTDLIVAGIHDIVSALQNPSPASPLAPLTDNHVQALTQLITLLTGITNAKSAPTLRVATSTKQQDSPSHEIAPVMRVEPTLTTPPNIDDVHTEPSVTPTPDSNANPTTASDNVPPSATPTATYDNSTGPAAQRRRRKQNKKKQNKNTNSSTTLPSKPSTTSPPASITEPPTHPHHTRSKGKRVHFAQTATDELVPVKQTDIEYLALHGNAVNPDSGQIAEYTELSRCSDGPAWIESCADEIGRLCQGRGSNSHMPTGTDTLHFIRRDQIPYGRTATYLRIVCADRPEKDNPRRVRFTVGGDRVDYPGDVSTKTADLATVKTLLNSTISTPGARFMTGDLKDFYLNTPLDRYEYMRMPVNIIPESIMLQYNLEPLVHNGYVYTEIRKGMYGLPQAGKIANDRLTTFLAPYGYKPTPITPGLWRHTTKDLAFTLVVDDFGVKYTNQADAKDLMTTLNKLYRVSEDWTGSRYCGLTIAWDYDNKTCDISIPGYIERALQRFNHPDPTRPQHSPHLWQKPQYGAKIQYTPAPDMTPALNAADTTRVQEVLGTLLFYARAVDSTMLKAIGTIATQQANATEATMKAITHLLNYCATHPEATVRFHASDMILHIDSDASYLSEPKARSSAAGYHYLSSHPNPDPNAPPPPDNGAINVFCQIMREVLSSAAEAELGALYHNGKEACPLRITLEELGHPQPPTPIQTDNSTAAGIANDTVKQKRSKAIDMRFYWIRDRVRQGQFQIFWKKGILNKADYFTKHHPPSHHQKIRPAYLHVPSASNRNYFECLQDDDPEDSAEVPASGEGVLNSGFPKGARTLAKPPADQRPSQALTSQSP